MAVDDQDSSIDDALRQSERIPEQTSRLAHTRDGLVGPGLNEDLDSGYPDTPQSRPYRGPEAEPEPVPSVRLSRPDAGASADQNLWTLIRNRSNAVSFNNYFRYVNEVMAGTPDAKNDLPADLRGQVSDLAFLGNDGFDVLKAATQFFLMHEVGLIVDGTYLDGRLTTEYLQDRYDQQMVADQDDPTEFSRRNKHRMSGEWLREMRDGYLKKLPVGADVRVLPYLDQILAKLRDLPLKAAGEVGDSYGILPSRVLGPLGLELIWSYWLEEGMLVQAHNAVTNRFQNIRTVDGPRDPLSGLDIDSLRRLGNVVWGWIQNRPFLLSIRRRAYEYDHQYGVKLLGTAVGEIDGVDSRSQFISAFHNLLHLATVFYQQDDDLTVHADGFPLLNSLRETQLVVTEGAHNQYGDLPWTARVEMLMQMWMFARPEMREFLGGRVAVPYKEPWMDRVDTVKSAFGWSDVNVTHFRDLATYGEQIVLSVRYGGWATENDSAAAANWARYWRPEIQGYVHAYRAATGADLRGGADTTMPGILLSRRLEERGSQGPGDRRAVPSQRQRPALGQAQGRGTRMTVGEAVREM